MDQSQWKSAYPELGRYVDVADGLSRIRNNKRVYRMILSSFVQDTHYDELRAQLALGDAEAVRVTAHTIKGLAANLSLPALLELTLVFEARLKAAIALGSSALPDAGPMGEAMEKTVECIGIVLQHLDELTL